MNEQKNADWPKYVPLTEVSKHLPQMARDMLREAVRTKGGHQVRAAAIDGARKVIVAMFPSYFRNEK